jgi:hypothetical protein
MPRQAKQKRKSAGHLCPVCSGTMRLKSKIPAAHVFPELKTFRCLECGNLRTVEDEVELAIADLTGIVPSPGVAPDAPTSISSTSRVRIT